MIQINYNKITLDVTDDVYIHPIGDLHVGHKNCDMDFIKSTLESIPKEPNHRIILMGDLMDTGIKNSIGASVYENTLTPQEQLDVLIELLAPFSKQIDGYVMGNHEYRIFKDTGIDVCKIVCDAIGIEYSLYSGLITYSLKHRAYNINYFHGRAGGGVENALKKCKEMSNKVIADVFLMGHCHQCAFTNRRIRVIDSRNEKVVSTLQHFVLTGHALKYDDSYAEQANLEISDNKFPILKLTNTKEKNITVYI